MTESITSPPTDPQQWLSRLKHVPKELDVVIHVGAPKTGSSAFQTFCFENRDWLATQGYYYPPHPLGANRISSGHSELSQAIKEGGHPETIFAKYLANAKSSGCTLLLSSETFWSLPVEIHALIKKSRYCVLALIRHPFDTIVSSYNQLVKRHFSTTPLLTFIEDYAKARHKRMTEQWLRLWVNTVGLEHLVVNPYHKSSIYQLGLSTAFMHMLRVTLPQTNGERPPLLNSSYPPHILELKRMLNAVIPEAQTGIHKRLDTVLQHLSDQYFQDRSEIDVNALIEVPQEALALLETHFSGAVKNNMALCDIELHSELTTSASAIPASSMADVATRLKQDAGLYCHIQRQIQQHLNNVWFATPKNDREAIAQMLMQLDQLFPKPNLVTRIKSMLPQKRT
ncbi:MAG: hypothetical protein JXR76_10465 [Deltaproteobacteria bacterium]|nr:hypothetical protein [Deltaproteobacteria bacterium]